MEAVLETPGDHPRGAGVGGHWGAGGHQGGGGDCGVEARCVCTLAGGNCGQVHWFSLSALSTPTPAITTTRCSLQSWPCPLETWGGKVGNRKVIR